MIIDCISDLHGHYPKLEGGDLLIVAGDLTRTDKADDYVEGFQPWLDSLDYKNKIIIAGNHDNLLQKGISVFTRINNLGNPIDMHFFLPILRCKYLCDSGTELEWEEVSDKEWGSREGSLGIVPYKKKKFKIWGSPWTLRFEGMNPRCMAFTCETEEELAKKWALIPDDVDILVTHSPPYGIKDRTIDGEFVGSETLAYHVGSMQNPPKLWVWGHIHESYGRDKPVRGKPCIMVNASHVNERYEPVNKPIRIEL